MSALRTYKHTTSGIVAACLVFLALLCSTNGLIVWNVARKISYEYVRSHRNELKFRDTIIVSATAITGNKELTWVKHDEIRYHGQMYDIKKHILLADGSSMLVGHYDDWDNGLFRSLERLLEPSPGQHSQKEKAVFCWLADAVIPPLQQQRYPTSTDLPPMHFPKDDHAFLTRYRPDVPVPPPNSDLT